MLFNLHSIINNGLIPGGQNSSKRQTVFFLPIDPRDKGHQDLAKIDFNEPRRAQYLHNAWKKHQDAVFWVDINLAIQKGLTFLSDSISRNASSLLYSKSCEIEDWRSLIWRNHTCLLDHHQRSHYDTTTIGPEGKFNWVLQLINNQKVKLFDSHEEKFNTQCSPN